MTDVAPVEVPAPPAELEVAPEPTSTLDPGLSRLRYAMADYYAQSYPPAGPIDVVRPDPPFLFITGAGSDGSSEFRGTAEAGATIHVYDSGAWIGTSVADAAGNWVHHPIPFLVPGTHAITFTAVDAAGNTSDRSAVDSFVQPPLGTTA